LCKNNARYIGCTRDLRERINRHSRGNVPATKEILPIKLSCYFAFANKYTAFNFEKYLKSGSGRAFTKNHFIQKLIGIMDPTTKACKQLQKLRKV